MTTYAEPQALSNLSVPLLRPQDSRYEKARRTWNGYFDTRPWAIAMCSDTEEVRATIATLSANDIPFAVRGGGHSYPGHSTIDEGVVINLSRMRAIRIDPVQRIAVVEPGVLLGELDRAAWARGMAVTGGQISHTGISGLTLGGGIGWLCRRLGLTVDNLVDTELVTADGTTLRCNSSENTDLFWGLRGGGGNFGVVTEFTFRLHAQGVCRSALYLVKDPARSLPEIDALVASAPWAYALMVGLVTIDGAPTTVVRSVNTDLTRTGTGTDDLLAAILGAPISTDHLTYPELQRIADSGVPHHDRYYAKSVLLDSMPPNLSGQLADLYADRPSDTCQIGIMALGGRVAAVAETETAYPNRQAKYLLTVLGRWSDPAGDNDHIDWCRRTYEQIRTHGSAGVYVNELTDDGTNRMAEAYGEDGLSRLQRLKVQYDPRNIFFRNQNISPIEDGGRL